MIEIVQGAYFPEVTHSVLQESSIYLAQFTMYIIRNISDIIDIDGNAGYKSAFFYLISYHFSGISFGETTHFT